MLTVVLTWRWRFSLLDFLSGVDSLLNGRENEEHMVARTCEKAEMQSRLRWLGFGSRIFIRISVFDGHGRDASEVGRWDSTLTTELRLALDTRLCEIADNWNGSPPCLIGARGFGLLCLFPTPIFPLFHICLKSPLRTLFPFALQELIW